jgi:hypothetical protein
MDDGEVRLSLGQPPGCQKTLNGQVDGRAGWPSYITMIFDHQKRSYYARRKDYGKY